MLPLLRERWLIAGGPLIVADGDAESASDADGTINPSAQTASVTEHSKYRVTKPSLRTPQPYVARNLCDGRKGSKPKIEANVLIL